MPKKGFTFSEESRLRMKLAHLGKKPSEAARLKMSLAHSGPNHHLWKGGITVGPNKKEYMRKWRIENRNRKRAYDFRAKLKLYYGITEKEYEQISERQRHRCAICSGGDGLKRLAVDHSHKTGTIRGLLCSRCNTALGLLKENQELLARAAAYLRKEA